DEVLDPRPLVVVGGYVVTAGDGDLREHAVGGRPLALREQLTVGEQASFDPLGVVEPIDAEEQATRVAELLACGFGERLDLGGRGHVLDASDIDRDGVGADPDGPAPE